MIESGKEGKGKYKGGKKEGRKGTTRREGKGENEGRGWRE